MENRGSGYARVFVPQYMLRAEVMDRELSFAHKMSLQTINLYVADFK